MKWERTLAKASDAVADAPIYTGTDAIFSDDAVVILSCGRHVTKITTATGAHQWGWGFPVKGLATHLFSYLQIQNGQVVAMARTEEPNAAAAHLVLDLDRLLPFSDLSYVSSLSKHIESYLVKTDEGQMRAVWTEYSRVRVAELIEDGTAGETRDTLPGNGKRFEKLIDVGLRNEGYMLATYESGTVVVLKVGDKAEIVHELEGSRDTKDGAPVFSAAQLPGGWFIFARVYYSFAEQKMMVQSVFVRGDEVSTSTYPIDFDMANDGAVEHAAIASVDGHQPSLILFTSTSAIQYHASADVGVKWTREESLADVVDVRFVDLGEPETEEALDHMVDESFVGRVVRQAIEIKNLPAFVLRFVNRMLDSSAVVATPPLSPGRLHRDEFGLQKLLVAVTRGGKVFGLDSANGNIVWSRNLGFFSQTGPELEVTNVFATRELSETGNPQVAILAARTRDNQVATLGYHIDAFTGDVAGDKDPNFGIPLGKELFSGSPKTAFLTHYENCCTGNRVVAVVDAADQLYIFPPCKKVAKAVEAEADRLFYSVLDRALEGTTLRGYAPAVRNEDNTFSAAELWARPFPAQLVLAATPLTPSQTASFGRALGDKSVLYKYMNPHLIVVTSVSPLTARGHVYVVDSTTGTTIHEIEISNVVGENVQAAMVENWLVYAWQEGQNGEGVGGWRMGSVELFEDGNEKSAGRSTLESIPAIKAISQTFILQHPVRALTFSTSKFGVTSKDVVYLNDKGQVAVLPRRVLDPRRPTDKPTKADQDEGLVPYAPLLPHHPTAVLSHQYRLIGLEHIATAPALLESTSLLLAYGLDLFCTRAVQPSGTFDILGDGFNKLQLLVTLAVLGVGVAVARPAVAKKNLQFKWF